MWLLAPLLLLSKAGRCLAAPPHESKRALALDAITEPPPANPPATEDFERRPGKLHEEIESALGQMHADNRRRAYIGWMSNTINMHRCIARYEEWAGMEELVGKHGRPPIRMIEVGTNFPERPDVKYQRLTWVWWTKAMSANPSPDHPWACKRSSSSSNARVDAMPANVALITQWPGQRRARCTYDVLLL